MTTHWCKHCGMSDGNSEGCPAYSKVPKTDCPLYIPMRFDGSVKE